MTLEELIHKRFADIPYPELIYSLDFQAGEEKHSAGILSVSLFCQNTAEVMPEALETLVRDRLRDVILKPEGGNPCCFVWLRTDGVTPEEEKSSLTIRREIRFEILEYPWQESADPDPVAAAGRYLKSLYPECLVMGCDSMGEITEVTETQPVIYCRPDTLEKAEETNTVVWMDSKIAVHIISPSHESRMKLAVSMANRMSLDGELILPDQSPMFLKGLSVHDRADDLKEGQLVFTGHYGLLRYRPEQHRLLQGKFHYE